ncbi:MAG: CapA family protein [Lentisphaerae bacterium]|jgi:hypothetical protein|nr:CapA family protein [Lentisphaerota bacterium]MBT4820456.1 CapA family protein [Lentisphaerota bacterium]MBT5610386.1 CapA family protein [Lentisphaerota bacterium]MBT7056214.1 CapA family protein [Lentisphaerota bacterium]MBT7841864.1 CapA family protein [Lentisphaerota bacterium]
MLTVPDHGQVRFGNASNDDARVLVTGDLCPVADVEESFLASKGVAVYGDLLPELLDKDLAITNLELALTRGGAPIDKCGPNLRAAPEIFPEMAKAEFDVYGVANNHSLDWGGDSFLETLMHIEKAGCHHVGGGRTATDAAKPLRMRVKGHDIAIFALTMSCDCDAGTSTPGANALNLPYNALDVYRTKQEGATVIVIFHDGKEHVSFPSSRIVNYCHAFVDAGASAVIGHHPHISRGLEHYKEGVIAYSLGNFLFPKRRETTSELPDFWYEGYALRLHLGEGKLTGIDVIPHCYSEDDRCLSRMPSDRRKGFLKRLNRLNDILANPGQNERYFSAAASTFSYYYPTIERYCNAMSADQQNAEALTTGGKMLNHYLTCNEHCDVLEAESYRQWKRLTDIPDDMGGL